MNLLPLPGPSLWASMLPPCISTSRFTSVRPMPSPPCDRADDALDLREHLEDAAAACRRDADAGVPDRHHHVAPLPLGGQPDAAPRLACTWRRC